MLTSPSVVEWCSLCNQREAHGTLTIEDPTHNNEHVGVPACVYCVSGIKNWVSGKMVIKERPDE